MPGIDMALINGNNPSLILNIIEGKDIGTLFKAK
jgi:glutamate 5-kinase